MGFELKAFSQQLGSLKGEMKTSMEVGEEKIQEILDFVHSFPNYEGEDAKHKIIEEQYRRDAETILSSGYSNSCAEDGEIFAYKAWKAGFPTLLVQMAEVTGYVDTQGRKTNGHVFALTEINGVLYWIDPKSRHMAKIDSLDIDFNDLVETKRFTKDRKQKHYIPVASGKNLKEMGIKNHHDMLENLKLALETHLSKGLS